MSQPAHNMEIARSQIWTINRIFIVTSMSRNFRTSYRASTLAWREYIWPHKTRQYFVRTVSLMESYVTLICVPNCRE
jgi:hypothetical protein